MKNILALLLLTFLFQTPYFTNEITLDTKVESVTLYHSGALVQRISHTKLNSGKNELVLWNISSKIVLSSLRIKNKEVTILNKYIIKKLTEEENNQLADSLEALTNQIALIESKFHEPGFITNVEELEKMSDFYSKKIQTLKKYQRSVIQRIEDAKELDAIELKNDDAAILKLIVSVDGALQQPFEMQYVCGAVGWSPSYEINVKSASDKTIEIKYLAKAMSQSGEDWDNVKISLSSSFPLESPIRLPKPEAPWTLSPNDNLNRQPANNNYQERNNQQIDQLEGVEYIQLNAPAFLNKRELEGRYSFQSNHTVFTFPIMTIEIPASYYYYGFPSIDPQVYLVSEITGWETLGLVDGVANLTFNGNDVGKTVMRFSEALDTLFLPIGKDNSVYMKRSEIADEKYFKSKNASKKKTTTLAYQYDLKNNNLFPVQFVMMDQIPISQSKLSKVDLIETSHGIIDDQIGEIKWVMELDSGQSENMKLIFEIETNGRYSYSSLYSSTKYRAINCPSF